MFLPQLIDFNKKIKYAVGSLHRFMKSRLNRLIFFPRLLN